jgi:hypothetical protein
MKSLPFLLMLAAIATGCGGGTADPSKQLVAITVTPASADAQNFSNGQVQFTAVGTSSDGSKAPIQALWTLNGPFTETPIADISLSSTGLAQFVVGGIRRRLRCFRYRSREPRSAALADDDVH